MPRNQRPSDVDLATEPHSATAASSYRSRWWLLLLLVVWVSASGAHCPQVLQQYTQPIPRALPQGATLAQIIDVVNDNSARVQSLSTTKATITATGSPTIGAQIAFQRPRSFRMVAQTFMGPEVDLGSNDELLWFWIRRSQPPALFYCRHDQFANSAARQVIPIEPEALIEAFGVVTFDTNAQIEGPFPVGNGHVEIKTKPRAPGQGLPRITIVDDSRGIVLQQHIYDTQGNRLATSVMSKHVRDPTSGATLPRHLEIQWPTTKFDMTIDMPELQINQLSADPRELFAKPTYNGYSEIDLAQPGALAPPPTASDPYRAQPAARY